MYIQINMQWTTILTVAKQVMRGDKQSINHIREKNIRKIVGKTKVDKIRIPRSKKANGLEFKLKIRHTHTHKKKIDKSENPVVYK